MSHLEFFKNLPVLYQILLKLLAFKCTKISYFTIITINIINTVRFYDLFVNPRFQVPYLTTGISVICYIIVISVPTAPLLHRWKFNQLFRNLSDASIALHQLGFPINDRKIRSKINKIFILVLLGLIYRLIQTEFLYFKFQVFRNMVRHKASDRIFLYCLDNFVFMMPVIVFYALILFIIEYLDQIESGIEKIIKSAGSKNNFSTFICLFNILIESIDLICNVSALPFFGNLLLQLMFLGFQMFEFLTIRKESDTFHPLWNPLIIVQVLQNVFILWCGQFIKYLVRNPIKICLTPYIRAGSIKL